MMRRATVALAAMVFTTGTAFAQSDINRGTTDVSNQNPNQAEPIPVNAEPPSATSETASAQPGESAPTAEAAPVPGSTGHMVPTPGIGIPDGRMGLQDQVTPIGQEAAAFHNNWLLTLCVIISVFVLALVTVTALALAVRAVERKEYVLEQ